MNTISQIKTKMYPEQIIIANQLKEIFYFKESIIPNFQDFRTITIS